MREWMWLRGNVAWGREVGAVNESGAGRFVREREWRREPGGR